MIKACLINFNFKKLFHINQQIYKYLEKVLKTKISMTNILKSFYKPKITVVSYICLLGMDSSSFQMGLQLGNFKKISKCSHRMIDWSNAILSLSLHLLYYHLFSIHCWNTKCVVSRILDTWTAPDKLQQFWMMTNLLSNKHVVCLVCLWQLHNWAISELTSMQNRMC